MRHAHLFPLAHQLVARRCSGEGLNLREDARSHLSGVAPGLSGECDWSANRGGAPGLRVGTRAVETGPVRNRLRHRRVRQTPAPNQTHRSRSRYTTVPAPGASHPDASTPTVSEYQDYQRRRGGDHQHAHLQGRRLQGQGRDPRPHQHPAHHGRGAGRHHQGARRLSRGPTGGATWSTCRRPGDRASEAPEALH